MTRDQFRDRFIELSTDGQVRLISQLAYDLTLLGRETYEPGTGNVLEPPRLRRVNEAVHRLMDQLGHLLSATADRYPDDVFAGIVCDHFEGLGLAPHFGGTK